MTIEETRVVHILGAGRSGSTVLGVTLGSHPDAVSVGELVNLVPTVWPTNGFCACGERVRGCDFWSGSYRRWSNAIDVDPARYARLQAGHERWRAFPSLLTRAGASGERLREYGRLTDDLYESVAATSGKRVIIDSSKIPARGLAISLSSRLDVRFLHLVRDPRGVAWSLLKSYGRNERGGVQRDIPARPPWRSMAHWLVTNVAADIALRRCGPDKVVRIRYEDFVRAPRSTLARIGSLVGLDYGDVGSLIERKGDLSPGHDVAGNRVRMKRRILVEGDFEWCEKMPSWGRLQIELLSRPLLMRYGYVRSEP